MIRFIGDVHGKIADYRMVRKAATCSIQVGDMGIGFVRNPAPVADGHMFIRGNHDNPAECRARADHLGDFGITDIGRFRILYVAGGFSIDRAGRLPGVSWWEDEELSYADFEKILDLVQADGAAVDIVVSHEAPTAITFQLGLGQVINTRTSQGLEAIRRVIKPKLWVFGHYHMRFYRTVDGCQYVGLDELEHYDV